jgi:hypothetical protein
MNNAFTQTLDWWKNLVSWDGVSHWSKYLIYSPRYMGPNALPVPKLSSGTIDSVSSFSFTGNYQFIKGDKTINPALYGYYCLVKDKVSIEGFFVPFEQFNTSHAIKEDRKVYYEQYFKKTAMGDLHLNVNIQLLNKIRKEVSLALRLGYRYPISGRPELASARMTDAPGYFFDISASRQFSKTSYWKWMTMAGFLVWQTNGVVFSQDDALLFGGGIEYNKDGFKFQTSVAGYLGYIDNGDSPIVYRINLEKRKKNWGSLIQFQQGLQDFKFTGFEAGIKYYLKK